jgi:anti-sigma factor RsiW
MKPHDDDLGCARVSESIESYLDGDLSTGESARTEGHLLTCPRCRHEMSLAKGVMKELRSLPKLECPDRVTERVFAEVEAVEPTGRTLRVFIKTWAFGRVLGIPRPALAGALALLVVFSSLMIERLNEPVEQASAEEIAQAEAAIKWTFAYVHEVGRRSGLAVRDEVFGAGLVEPAQRAVRSTLGNDDTPNSKGKDGGSI